jgi:hypothetical protein
VASNFREVMNQREAKGCQADDLLAWLTSWDTLDENHRCKNNFITSSMYLIIS